MQLASVQQDDIKQVPSDAASRAAIRRTAVACVAAQTVRVKPGRADLEKLAQSVLADCGLPASYLGFAMVALNNAFWRESFAAVPFHRRLLLLPHCLRNETVCEGEYDSVGLNCAGCGSCDIDDLKRRAEELGYSVVVAEGTSSVLMRVLEGQADAILGVACLDSLEKSYGRIGELGVPHVASPLLVNGCQQTTAEYAEVLAFLSAQRELQAGPEPSHLPLLRLSARLFSPEALREALPMVDLSHETDRVALEWLDSGGKRLRPFVTMAAYAATALGRSEFATEEEAESAIPEPVRRIAVAIEILHKASLVHDDIEDDDRYRYGQETLHRRFGVGFALNVGDYLIGLGYRLIAEQAESLGSAAVADILACLTGTHLELCRGQGAELSAINTTVPAAQVLEAYALKTAPAFYAAVYCGLRAGGEEIDTRTLREFCTYLGEGYQIQNDLDDWEHDGTNKVDAGSDAAHGRPTILRAFAGGATGPDMQQVYTECGAFAKAEALLARVRDGALAVAGRVHPLPVGDFLASLTRMVLPDRAP